MNNDKKGTDNIFTDKSRIKIIQFHYNQDNLGYLIHGKHLALAIDGGAHDKILSYIKKNNLTLIFVTNTHSHMDHTCGNTHLLSGSNAVFIDNKTLITEKDIALEGEQIHVLHTPGHTSDSVSFHHGDFLVSGDTLFNGKVGRCFSGDLECFLDSIKKIMELPESTIIYAGHDYVEEYMTFAKNLEPDNKYIDKYLARYNPDHVFSTLKEEKKVNPFLRFNDKKIISILKKKGLPVETEYKRWESLMSLM